LVQFIMQQMQTLKKKYALKIEPHDSGPLYCEFHFYSHVCKETDQKSWLAANKRCTHLGIPHFVAANKTDYKTTATKEVKLRWLVMPLYPGGDLHAFIEKTYPDKRLPRHIVNKIAITMIWSLKYMHDKNYAHADVKGMNILLDRKPTEANFKAYLVDFGLASKILESDTYKPDKKMAGNGTIEYTSRDAHAGAKPSAYSDFEILLYCILHWATGTLPWMKKLSSLDTVGTMKEKAMKNTGDFLKSTWKDGKCGGTPWPELVKYAKLVEPLKFGETPPYDKLLACFDEKMAPEKTASKSTSSKSVTSKKVSKDSESEEEPVKPKRGRKKAPEKESTTQEEASTSTPPAKKGRARKAPVRRKVVETESSAEEESSEQQESSQQESVESSETEISPAKPIRGRGAQAVKVKTEVATPKKTTVSKANKRKNEDDSLTEISRNVQSKLKVKNTAQTPRQRRAAKSRTAILAETASESEDQENIEPEDLVARPEAKKTKISSPKKAVPKSEKQAMKREHKKGITRKNKNPVSIQTQTTPGLKRRAKK